MIKLNENPRLERLLAIISAVVIAVNFIVCIVIIQVRKNDITEDGAIKKEAAKKIADSSLKRGAFYHRQ